MSYRLRGEICVDVEDFQYDIELVVNGPEGISQLMSENNVTTNELVEYQNEYGADEYRVEITDANIGEYIGNLCADGITDLAERCIRTLKSRYNSALTDENNTRAELSALKLKHMPTSESNVSCNSVSN
jgi:hypothetical protein